MIKFFRTFRKDQVKESRPFRYIIYAIGEIILVVIGILIALQINEWNTERNNKKEEKGIILNLKDEFRANANVLQQRIDNNMASLNACHQLINLFGKDKEVIALSKPDSLILETSDYNIFIASTNTIDDILHSGRLQLLQNRALRDYIFEWIRQTNEAETQFRALVRYHEDNHMPYLIENYSWKNVDRYGPINWKEESSLYSGGYSIFNDIKFENIVNNQVYYYSESLEDYKELQTLLYKIEKHLN